MPPSPRLRAVRGEFYETIQYVKNNYKDENGAAIDLAAYPWKDNKSVVPCGGMPVIAGRQTQIKHDIVNVIFPIDPSIRNLAGVPHRGHLIKIKPSEAQYKGILDRAVE